MPRFHALCSSVVLLSLALSGCLKGRDRGEADPGGSAPAGPAACAEFSKALCDKAGADDPHCGAIRNLEGILSPNACAVGTKQIAFTELALIQERKPCTDLTERLCKDIGEATESCKGVRNRVPGAPPAQCKLMTEQYASVLDGLRQAEEKLKPLDAAKQATLLQGAKVAFGPSDAKVNVVIFSDFQCPFCAQASKTVEVIRHNFSDKVRFVFRQFPLPFHEQAHLAAQASLAAEEQGKFWEFHEKAFANPGAVARENLDAYAREIGLDMARFKSALDSGKFKSAVDADLALGKTVNVEATPTMFIDGKAVPRVSDAPAVVAAIDTELKR